MTETRRSADALASDVERRAETQRLGVKLIALRDDHSTKLNDDPDAARVYGHLCGIAFSLWRAAFLSPEDERERLTVTERGYSLLRKWVQKNAVSFDTELTHSTWMAGFYLNNAYYRLSAIRDDDGKTLGLEAPLPGPEESMLDAGRFSLLLTAANEACEALKRYVS